ncbi:MAG: inositol monophosphatase [Desulfobacterales bacterium]|nr:inositol monophosphatase [Desulfobacterales bacterium]MBF0398853.1 inositol monophosphatase [Desulfobacterales bacterium]
MEKIDINLVKKVALSAAYQGSKILNSKFGKHIEIIKKGEIDLVTEADRECENAIIRTINHHFPDHSILAEETGLHKTSSIFKWIIDPLDGTTNFAHGIPIFSISIAFSINDDIIFGVVLNPVLGELFTGEKGKGASLNGKTIRVSETKTVSNSLLVTGFPYNFKEIFSPLLIRFSNCIKAAQGIRRLGSASLDLCFVACGRFDCFFEQNLKPWDTAAGLIIAEESGANVTDFSNMPYNVYKNEVLATNNKIHDEMISLLRLD